MGSAPSAPLPLARLAGVGAVVFLANAALLVLQLVASRLLAPFIGSDLYTWTSIIGVFLAGIAVGNAYGGRLADRYPTPRTLALLLALGAAAAVWMVLFYMLLKARPGLYRAIPLGPRIPLLSAVLCFPAGLVLSLLTPLAIRLGLPDVSKTGRVAGLVFALSTLGCLLGNYVTGFYLIPAFTINTLVYVAAGSLLALAAAVFAVLKLNPPANEPPSPGREPGEAKTAGSPQTNPFAFADIRTAYLIVFLSSFCGMTLELTASRVIAQHLGVSLYTWTGIIGVMLAGTALGNLTGGLLADRANQPGSALNPRACLAATLLIGGGTVALVLVILPTLTWSERVGGMGLISQVLVCTFALFFLPMFSLGTVSPQVIRLAVPDVAHVGRVAGRVYAWSTAGAIAGTFAAGYVLVSSLGARGTLLTTAFVIAACSWAAARVWRHNLLLYLFAVVMGGVTGGYILMAFSNRDEDTAAVLETNYYTIKVSREYRLVDGVAHYTGELKLTLDHLVHSSVNPDDPTYIYYEHEHIQMEFLRAARARTADPTVLVIGGGGYTFPRYAKTLLPETRMDVVEIDPGVTRVAYEHLGLKKELGIRDINMDGRQFVAERAAPGSYDLVIQDAVNDLSVPSHLLTKEYNDEVKAALKPGGVYLLTIIDEIEHGKLWRASMATLRRTFPHVVLLSATSPPAATPPDADDPDEYAWWERWSANWPLTRQVYVIYASDRPLDEKELRTPTYRAYGYNPEGYSPTVSAAAGSAIGISPPFHTHVVPDALLAPFLERDPGVILTDQYAPVDNLMAEVFRRRNG